MLEPAVYCYHCEFCRSGRHNVCSNIAFFSTPPEPGFFREFVNMPAHNLVPLPNELDWDLGTLFEPLAVVLHSLDSRADHVRRDCRSVWNRSDWPDDDCNSQSFGRGSRLGDRAGRRAP